MKLDSGRYLRQLKGRSKCSLYFCWQSRSREIITDKYFNLIEIVKEGAAVGADPVTGLEALEKPYNDVYVCAAERNVED